MLYVDLLVQGVIQAGVYALMAVGLTLVYGLLRILHVAHAGLFTLGAYFAVVLTNHLGHLWLAALIAVPLVGLAGMAIYRLVYEPILDRPPFVALIASIGLFICMEEAFRLVFGPYGNSFDAAPIEGVLALGPLVVEKVQAAIVLTAVVLIGGLAVLAGRTRLGVAWRASVSEPDIARAFGINTTRVRYINFFIGSALAAVAGILVALFNNFVEPTMGSVPSYKMLAIIVLGGLGNVKGTLAASLALGILESFGTIYVGHLIDRDAIAFLFLIAILMVRPQGFFGRA